MRLIWEEQKLSSVEGIFCLWSNTLSACCIEDVSKHMILFSWQQDSCLMSYFSLDNTSSIIEHYPPGFNITVLSSSQLHLNPPQLFLAHFHCSLGSVVKNALILFLLKTLLRKYSHLSAIIFGLGVIWEANSTKKRNLT